MPGSDATVIATFSRRMRLRLDDGTEVDAKIRGRKLRPVCGDRVHAESLAQEDAWLITSISARRNVLTRPNRRGESEVLAANVDQLVVVAAPSPTPDWYVVDRYLCAAELMQVAAAVVYNKSDLEVTPDAAAELANYRAIGYRTLETSATSARNLDALANLLRTGTGVIVGQSGVGKSSLINMLCAGAELRTGAVSSKRDEGRHTTVNSMMMSLPRGGAVIDSPGVRDYAPALVDESDVEAGFREIHASGRDCRFANCRHLREPGCAVKAAVDEGGITARRYESFRRLLALTRRLAEKF